MAESPKLRTRIWWLLGLIAALWFGLDRAGWLATLERTSLDWRFKARGELQSPVKVVYVDVDSRSISDLGNQPWDRSYFADVAAALLNQGGARAVGIDYVFSDNGIPDIVDRRRFDEGRRALASFLNSNPAPEVVVAASYASPSFRDVNGQARVRDFPLVGTAGSEVEPPELPEFRMGALVFGAPNVGLIDTINGDTEAVHAFAQVGSKTWYHMAIELARLYWKASGVRVDKDRLIFERSEGDVVAPLRNGQDLFVNWFSAWDSPQNSHTSFSWALVCARTLESGTAEERVAAAAFFERFKDAVVLIGPVDPLLHDLAPTPFDPLAVPRVGIHGNLLKTLVSGLWIQKPGRVWDVVWYFAFPLGVAWVAFRGGRHPLGWRTAAGGLIVVYAALVFWIFSSTGWVLPFAGPLAGALSTLFGALALQLILEERQKRRIQGLFGTYLSPDLVARMVASHEEPKLGGEEVELTAYFSDIQNFTTLSESLRPSQLVELMNQYLTACTDCITEGNGTLDKYVGDGVVAMFGAPVRLEHHAAKACHAAWTVQKRLQLLRQSWASETARWPAGAPSMRTRIGLASGPVVVGNMGSQTRFNYTMTGDTVNLASRLESAAKWYGADIVVAETTKALCERAGGRWLFRALDKMAVVGRSQPLWVYELLGSDGDETEAVRQCAEQFAKGLAAYHERAWRQAAEWFQASAEKEPRSEDPVNPSKVYLARCAYFTQNPPAADWDGVWVQSQK